MNLYSQRDPTYSSLKLGSTTIGKDGCVVMSLATILQVDPLLILNVKGAFNSLGECDIKRVLEYFGAKLTYRGRSRPTGICMAKTAYYKKAGVPTHFFPYIPETNECIDPLQHPTFRGKNMYPISEYLWIDGVKLDFTAEDLQKRITIAENALKRGRLTGLRESSVVYFINRAKKILSSLLSL